MIPPSQSYTYETPGYFVIQHHESFYVISEMMKHVRLTGKFLFIVNYMLLSDFNGKHRLNPHWEPPYQLIKEKYKNATALGKKFFYVIECLPEAQNYFYELSFIEHHIKKVMELCNLEPHQIINLSGAHDSFPSPYQHCTGITQFGVGVELVNTVHKPVSDAVALAPIYCTALREEMADIPKELLDKALAGLAIEICSRRYLLTPLQDFLNKETEYLGQFTNG
jgi:hypothetical protein